MSSNFWAMGGYASFVWSSYGIAGLALISLALTTYVKTNKIRSTIIELINNRAEK